VDFRLAKAREERALRFLQHLEPLKAALEAYCRRSVHDPNAVEDVLQDAVGKAFRDFHLYAEGTNFRAWIFHYLTLEIYAGNRAYFRQRHEPISEALIAEKVWDEALDEPLVERLLEHQERILNRCDDALAAAIYDLAPLERSAFLLRVIGQLKYREVADILEAPIGTIMSALSRARARLRIQLADYGREHGLLGPDSVRSPK
jgi:RNA polymerase sigma-70 factor, ECF subfamily